MSRVVKLYVAHQELKADLAKKKTRGVECTRFREHCEAVPWDVRDLHGVVLPDGAGPSPHAASGRRQARTCRKIDEALEAAMSFWAKDE